MTIIKGDCLEVMKTLNDKSIDMILCDLPYGTTSCHWDTIIPFEPLWEQYKRIIKDNGAIVLTACQPFTSALVSSNFKMFRHHWVWDKVRPSGHLLAKKRPLMVTEDIVVFSKKSPVFNPQMTPRVKPRLSKNNGNDSCYNGNKKQFVGEVLKQKYPINIITQLKVSHSIHPSQKPEELFEYLIKTYSNEGDLILDNCAGSGTTGVACLNTNRRFILIEKNEDYFNIIQSRLSNIVQT